MSIQESEAQIQVGSARDAWVARAESSRAFYRDASGALRQNPVHVAAMAEVVAFEGSVCGLSTGPATRELGPATMCAAESGMRVVAGPGQELDRCRILSLEEGRKMVTAALGTRQGRMELLAGIENGVCSRLRKAGFAARPQGIGGRPVVARHSYAVQVFEASSCNPRFSPAEAAVAALGSNLARQLREQGAGDQTFFVEVSTLDEYSERTFGWTASICTEAVAEIGEPGGQEDAQEQPSPPEQGGSGVGVPKFRVFQVWGGHRFAATVPGGPPLRHRGGAGSTTVWSSLLSDLEAADLVAQVSKYAEIAEVEFEADPKPGVDEAAEALLEP